MNAYTDNICRYFDQTSPANTRRALEIACQRAVRPDISRMVIPTYPGKIVAVTTTSGSEKPDAQAFGMLKSGKCSANRRISDLPATGFPGI